ncbi:ABC transporter substrate-binding protein [Paenibacillus sp. GCM10027626]|uniref:ABC transporter substrate-binding protein n=1 Tax=Paenibacillus sp. GCM10027626 TaxID=3273411 RepID=UPI00363910EB
MNLRKGSKAVTLLLSVLIVLVAMTTACGQANKAPDKTNNGGNAAGGQSAGTAGGNKPSDADNKPSTEPVSGGTVRLPIATEPDNLDPFLSSATDTASMMDNVFDGLLTNDETGKLLPGIAESYEISADGLAYTFKLRPNVKFHNGELLTAEDVKYSYELLAGIGQEKPLSSKFEMVAGIETPDAATAVIQLKQKDASFITRTTVAILPHDYKEQSKQPIGAGPFKFVSYSPGQSLVLERFADFYDPENAAKIDRVEFKFMNDASATLLALQAGTLDMLPSVTVQGEQQLGDSFTYVEGLQNMVQLLALNNKVKPLDDARVRQAIYYAVDVDELIATIVEGKGTKLGSNMSPAMEQFYEPGLESTYDVNVEKAKSLLNEAGLANGFELEITVPSNYQTHVDTAQVIAEQLKKVGITVKIKQIEWSNWLEDVYTNRKYTATVIGFTGKLDPYDVLIRYETNYPRNFINFSDAAYDELMKQGTLEADIAKRAEIYKKAQHILTEQAASVFIMDFKQTAALKKGLEGFKIYANQLLNMADLYYTN